MDLLQHDPASEPYFGFLAGFWSALLILLPASALSGEFVRIEAGHFVRGNMTDRLERDFPKAIHAQYYGASEKPWHPVILTRPFEISTTEVSVKEWRGFIRSTDYTPESVASGRGMRGWSPSQYGEGEQDDWPRDPVFDFVVDPKFTWEQPGFEQGGDHPVVGITWNDAVAYCQWMSERTGREHRLPTEAEWEYVAKAGLAFQHFHWGNAIRGRINELANIANVEMERHRPGTAMRKWLVNVETESGDGHIFTAPVGSFPPNPWGIHDLNGNVFEWCQDYFHERAYEKWEPKQGPNPVAIDPANHSEKNTETSEMRVIRGGSFYTGPLAARSSARGYFDAGDAAAYIGFRVVREVKETGSGGINLAEQYASDIELIESAGGNFRPLNREQTLSLRGVETTPEIAAAVSRIPTLYRIQDIKLEQWDQGSIDAIAGMRALYSISIQGSWGSEADWSKLGAQRKLSQLSMPGEHLTPRQLNQVAELSSLSRLDLGRVFGSISDEQLSRFAGSKSIESLSIYDAALSGSFLNAFSEHPRLSSLVISGLGSESVDQGWSREGSAAIQDHLPWLNFLSLAMMGMSDDALEPLKEHSRLETLELIRCPNLTDPFVADLVASLPRLEVLRLRETSVGPEVALAIPGKPFLKELTVEASDLDLTACQQIARSRILRKLDLRPRDQPAPLPPGALNAFFGMTNLRELSFPIASPPPIDSLQTLAGSPALERLVLWTRDEELFKSWEAAILEVMPTMKVNRR
ncbi:MAG: SUMF1/EgtB/PvdO family nonheme iron enzyme [Verrucomicrobiota bacterium]